MRSEDCWSGSFLPVPSLPLCPPKFSFRQVAKREMEGEREMGDRGHTVRTSLISSSSVAKEKAKAEKWAESASAKES